MLFGVVIDDGTDDAAEIDIEREKTNHDPVVGFISENTRFSLFGCRVLILPQMRWCNFTAVHSGKDD